MKPLFVNALLLIGLLGRFTNPVSAIQQSTIEFRNVSVRSSFPDGITFRIEICGRSASSRAVFNYSVSPENSRTGSWVKEIWSIDEGQTSDNCDKRKFYLETKDLEIPPFAPVQYYWTVTENSTVKARSSNYIYYYRDGNHDWKTIQNKNLILWWHDRPDSFGRDIMSIASSAYQDQAKIYSMTLESPITIVVTNTLDEFFAWQPKEDSSTGMTLSDLNLTIQLVEEGVGYYGWAKDVIPHAISHIYFDHLVKGYSGASPWLEEGMATYLEYDDHYEEWKTIRDAYREDHLLPLDDLVYDFGDNDDNIDLAYAEGYYAVLYMHEEYGSGSVSILLEEFNNGATADSAFQTAFGKNPAEFEKDFMVWLKKRVETPPPSTEIQKALSKNESNLLFFSLVGLCSLPLCFAAFGAGVLFILWKLNSKSSVKKDKTTVP
jgi:hypothetical protein